MDSSTEVLARSSRATCTQSRCSVPLLAELLQLGVQVLERPEQSPRCFHQVAGQLPSGELGPQAPLYSGPLRRT